MNAGRELDELVAEQVMGWIPYKRRWTLPGSTQELALPYFSTDIAAAWQVVAHLHNRVALIGPGATYAYGEYTHGSNDGWVAEVDGFVEEAPTASHAICLASLKAVGYEEA